MVAAIEKAFRETCNEPTIANRLKETQQMDLTLDGPAGFDKFFKSQITTWGKFVKDNNIRAE